MNWRTALRLGRVSNLPTVWSNTLAGATLAAPGCGAASIAALAAAFSLFYVGGMYLNDAFDREIDARERPDRPIPSGAVAAGTVLTVGYCLLVAATIVIGVIAAMKGHIVAGLGAGVALGTAIVYYDASHKKNSFSPFVMGLCRSLIYIGAALALSGRVGSDLGIAALLLLAYVAGLTYVARHEASDGRPRLWPLMLVSSPLVYPLTMGSPSAEAMVFLSLFAASVGYALVVMRRGGPPSIQRAVALMIAAVSLLDATFMASQGAFQNSAVAVGAFGLTLALQRYVPAT